VNLFLGGTCNNSHWRDELIPQLEIDYFNPVVTQWNDDCLKREFDAKQSADFWLFVITPKIEGYYSLAEVIDTSYKHTDRTIYCILEEDEGSHFNAQQLAVLEDIGQTIEANGSLRFNSLSQISDFFKATSPVSPSVSAQGTFDVFISYGRRHSKDFAVQLREALLKKGYSVWLDKENIAIAVDFQQKIDEGIRHAANFCFIISPHSVHSEYCSKELNKAKEFNKRIIPIHHIDMEDCLDDIPSEIMRLNWMKFDQPELFDSKLDLFVKMLEQDKNLVTPHCELLLQAEKWRSSAKHTDLLLYGHDMTAAALWLDNIAKRSDIEITPLKEHTQFINASQYFSLDAQAQICILYPANCISQQQELEYHLICNGFIVCSVLIDTALEKKTQFILRKSANIVLLSPEPTDCNVWLKVQSFLEQEQKRYFSLLNHYINIKNSDFNTTIKLDENDSIKKLTDSLIEQLQINFDYLCLRNNLYCRAMQWAEFQTHATLLTHHESADYVDFITVSTNKIPFGTPDKLSEFIAISKEHIEQPSNLNNIDIYICFDQEDSNFVMRLNRRLRELNKTSFCNYVQSNDSDEISIEIQHEISNAKFVFFIVPRQVSKSLSLELNTAEQFGKHIIPIKLKRFSTIKFSSEYKHYQTRVILVDEELEFSKADILNALNINNEYLESHRYWLQKEQLWQKDSQSSEFLLGTKESLFASKWLETAMKNHSEPAPTVTQSEFINISQQFIATNLADDKRSQRRLKTFSILSTFLCALSLILFFNLYIQSKQLENETLIAKSERSNAQKQEKLAQKEKNKALKQEILAQKERDNAMKQELLAQKERDKALKQELLAQKERDNAKRQEKRAIKNKEQADKSAVLAQIEKQNAQRLKSIAEAEALIYQAEMLKEPKKQFVMALSAYHVLEKNGGNTNNNILFNLLYQQQKKHLPVLKGHKSKVVHLVFSQTTQQLISIDSKNMLYLWQVSSTSNIKPIYHHKLSFKVKQIYLSPQYRELLLLSQSGKLYKWDINPKNQVTLFENFNFTIKRISLVKTNEFWLQGLNTLYVYNSKGNKVDKHSLELNKNTSLFLSKDANVLLTYNQGTVKLFRRNNQLNSYEFYWSEQQKQLITHAIFDQKNNMIIWSDAQGWFYQLPIEPAAYEKSNAFRAHSHHLIGGILSNNNDLFSASLDGTIKFWQTSKSLSKNSPIQLTHNQWFHSLSLADIGQYTFIFAGTESGDIKQYPGQINYLIERTKQLLSANNKKEKL